MADPKLVRTRVQINYKADDDYKAECIYRSGLGTMIEGKHTKPEDALLTGIDELARLLCLFGFEHEMREAVDGAARRVQVWREQREKEHG